jgi:hypothetical protein
VKLDAVSRLEDWIAYIDQYERSIASRTGVAQSSYPTPLRERINLDIDTDASIIAHWKREGKREISDARARSTPINSEPMYILEPLDEEIFDTVMEVIHACASNMMISSATMPIENLMLMIDAVDAGD